MNPLYSRNKRLMRLTQDVPVPKTDRRRDGPMGKGGVFLAGTRFTVEERNINHVRGNKEHEPPEWWTWLEIDGLHTWVASPMCAGGPDLNDDDPNAGLPAAIFAAGEPVPLTDFFSALTEATQTNTDDRAALLVLQGLWQRGILSLEDLRLGWEVGMDVEWPDDSNDLLYRQRGIHRDAVEAVACFLADAGGLR